MGAHAIIARRGGEAMWHVHFSTPEAFSHSGEGGRGGPRLAKQMPGAGEPPPL